MTLPADAETILGALPDLIFRIGRDGTIRGVRAHDPGELFKPEDQIVGQRVQTLMPPAFAALCMPLVERALEDGALQFFEYSLPFPDGDRWYEARIARAREDEVLAIVRDISAQKATFQALERSERRFQSLVQGMDAIVWEGTIDDFRFTFVSDRAESMLGYPVARWYEAGFFASMLHPDDRDETIARCLAATEKREDHELEYRVITADGRTVWLRDRVRLPDGAARGVMLDITAQKSVDIERQRMQQQLLLSQKLESTGLLAGRIAHDFNNLLTAILGNASILLLQMPADSPLREHVDEIRLASERAADLTRQVLSYSGKGTFETRKIDLSEQVREIAPLIQTSLSSAIELRLALADDLPPIEADGAQIQQVIMNLVLNAAQASTGGLVAVTTGAASVDEGSAAALDTTAMDTMALDTAVLDTAAMDTAAMDTAVLDTAAMDTAAMDTAAMGATASGPRVFLEVRDFGVGMSPDTQERMFDPFFTTKPHGRGLGLASVLGIVRSHGGALHVESAVGRGTTIRALFPASLGRAERRAVCATSGDVRGAGLVLVVDDEPAVRAFARAALTDVGYEVVLAADGRAGLEAFSRVDGDSAFVVLDMTMPVMNGETAFLEMRRLRPDVRVLLVSGYDEAEATRRFTADGLAGFLQKPFTARQLAEKVRALASPRAPRTPPSGTSRS